MTKEELTEFVAAHQAELFHNLFIDHCRRRGRSSVSFSSEQAETAEEFRKTGFYPHDEGFGGMETLEQSIKGLSESQREPVDAFPATLLSLAVSNRNFPKP